MRKETDVPLFPEDHGNVLRNESTHGMTLRDYFAGQALAGICSRYAITQEDCDSTANRAYQIADAMISESQK